MLGIISGIEPVLSRVWAVIIGEGGTAGLGPVWASVYLWTRVLVCLSFQVVDSRSLRTDALIGEFRVNALFSLKAVSSHLSTLEETLWMMGRIGTQRPIRLGLCWEKYDDKNQTRSSPNPEILFTKVVEKESTSVTE